MLRDKAEEAFVTEIAASLGLTDDQAMERVQEILESRAARV
jgi:protein-disulfide isomerase-like protein with CxxC motif